MSPESRKERVKFLFQRIALIAGMNHKWPTKRDELIKPLSEELWAITQEQWKLGELDHLHGSPK